MRNLAPLQDWLGNAPPAPPDDKDNGQEPARHEADGGQGMQPEAGSPADNAEGAAAQPLVSHAVCITARTVNQAPPAQSTALFDALPSVRLAVTASDDPQLVHG